MRHGIASRLRGSARRRPVVADDDEEAVDSRDAGAMTTRLAMSALMRFAGEGVAAEVVPRRTGRGGGRV